MVNILVNNQDKEGHNGMGGKATNLLKLENLQITVPKWVVIPQEVLVTQLTDSKNVTSVLDHDLQVPKDILPAVANYFGTDYLAKTYAVRSSAMDEDGVEFSFAGQFETFLHVPFTDITAKIIEIWKSTVSERVLKYREENNLPIQLGIAVIIQEMVSPDVSGVAFGAHPVSGDVNAKVISSVYGLGEGLVSGELNADTFTVIANKIETSLTAKTHAFIRSKSGNGIEKTKITASKIEIASLSNSQILEICKLLDRLNINLGSPQDIEFAYQNNTLFLLQTRPITTIKTIPKGEYILWDNSNIIESYPGITTPLTFSFILKMYEMVYRQFVGIMGVNQAEIQKHSDVFANTLGLVRGRVYYNLLSWYKMLAMLPGYSLNAEYMEKMMGVKERFELPEDFKMNKGLARFRILGMLLKMLRMQGKLKGERKRFLSQLNQIMTKYQAINFNELTPTEIINHYLVFEESLLLRWKAPLINDFFAMIWFGMLEKQAAKTCPDEPNIHNDLLCGSQDIISVEPIHRSIALAHLISSNNEAKQLFTEGTPEHIWEELSAGVFPEIKSEFDNYIVRFGDRCVGELKLETISYSQNPALFVKVIKSYVIQGITLKKSNSKIENDLRTNAENKIAQSLKNKPIKRWWFNYVTKKSRDLVSNRENLRYERTRGFGMVRNMFSALGEKWFEKGFLKNPRDIFYLELSEIKSLKNGVFNAEFIALITERKVAFEQFKNQTPPQERFFSYGNDFNDEFIYSIEKLEDAPNDLKGIGCCPGRVQGTVRIVNDPNEIESLNGDILVTSSTDPGWVTLFPTTSAIIVERGSLLSHSAIVSREMGIPCIVSVTGLLRTLKTGDQIIMDGSTGQIKKVKL